MCGGLASAFQWMRPSSTRLGRGLSFVGYHTGRLTTYALLGLLFGLLGAGLQHLHFRSFYVLRAFAAAALVAYALVLMTGYPLFAPMERAGARFGKNLDKGSM